MPGEERSGEGPNSVTSNVKGQGSEPPDPQYSNSATAQWKRCTGQEIIVAEFHRKIKEAFEVFDHEANNTVDVREIGTIVRSLGCCPNEGELHDLIAEVEEEEPTGYIRFEKFLPVMTNVLLERRYRPIPEDILLRAFEVLDTAKRGFLSKEELIKYMTEEGEPFSQEEMEEMLSAAIDPESNSIHYKDYITMMVIDEN
ncbi:PREDICTED: EF-hand calcium-binding domain-containing protein 2 [Miniopterus natalensis]|uniref:EF-hand calcium-binding domain-containing protein 2 n=1 Tax=Miniopterus natalensis TaxID=291302 RepID=UPI0007A6B3AD|nr:PREDICTED: EF-hand calcium-binding domain-containing protein 2 [Miniopterus natalensis]